MALIALLVSFVLALIFSGLHPFRQTVQYNAPLPEFTAYMDKYIPELMDRYAIPGSSIALVKEGKITWLSAYGYADLEKGQKMTTDTPMRVQSISKSVTAWGILKLAQQGKIILDLPVAQYLKSWQFPESGFASDQVTVRHLLSHTAGLPLGDVFTIYAPEETMPSLQKKLTQEAVLIRDPGTSFSYSNTGYNLLELLIEEITGQSFAAYMRQEVLNPLGMNRSTFEWSEKLAPAVPTGYALDGTAVPVYVYPEKASGGLFATAEDIAAFAIAGMEGASRGKQVLSPGTTEGLYLTASNQIGVYGLVFDSYGLGHYLETLPNGKKAISHGGQGTGIMTHFHAVPESGDAIVILTNSQRSWPFIAYLLSDWATWRGFPSVGMGRIIWGKYLLWAVTGLVWAFVLLQALRLARGILKGTRQATLPHYFQPLRLAQVGFAVAIPAVLTWCLGQKYLFLTSVFPRASLGLGSAALLLSAVLLLSALFTKTAYPLPELSCEQKKY
jgi:CubicO group peptidase (beta-lactamase class C family)